MIFFKNILKKKGINSYLLTLFIILFLSLFFVILNKYLEHYKYNLNNSIEKRTIIIKEKINCNNENIIYMESCINDSNDTRIIVDNYKNVPIVAKTLEKKYNITYFDIDNNDYNNIIIIVQILSIMTFLACIFIIFIIIIQHNKDDYNVMKILRCIGYSKIKLFFINAFVFLSIMTFLSITSFFLITIIVYIFFKYISFKEIISIFLIQYFIIASFIVITYFIMYISMNRKKIK